MNRPELLIRLLPPSLHWSPDREVRVVGRRIGLFHIVKAHRVDAGRRSRLPVSSSCRLN
jgi:hypothetical protein